MKRYIYSLLLSTMFFTSCEEVIEINLDEAESRIVIEGLITDQLGPYTVKISESVGFYEDNEFPGIGGATVKISDGQGNVEVLEEVEEGIYQTTSLQGQRGVEYHIEVELAGEVYTARSRMQDDVVPIDSLVFRFEEESLIYDEGYYFRAYFEDPAGLGNYYRFKVLVNGEPYQFDIDGDLVEDNNLWLADDKYTDGNAQDWDFPHTLETGDKVSVRFYHINKAMHDYYRTLAEVINGGGVAPSNPLSNFGNGALGYFGAVSVTSIEEVVE